MEQGRSILMRALISGTIGGIATAIAAALAGKREDGSYAAPLNATSHIIWGDKAAHKDNASLKYTATGFLLNHTASIFWAWFYEKWFGQGAQDRGRSVGRRITEARSLVKPILGAAVVSAGAYINDYYLIPERFTPGFEKRLSGKSMVAIFATLAVGLALCDLLEAARRNAGN